MVRDSLERGDDQARLIASLRTPAIFGAACTRVSVVETHISWVLLTGPHAYKIKKAVDLEFLDFTTLAKRRHFCERELALNRRLAPALYLDVVPITGTVDAPVVGGRGPAIEYAVRMREFPQEGLASRLLAHNELGAADIDALAAKVASFHASIGVAGPDAAFGRPDDVLRDARQNFAQVRPMLTTPAERAELDALAEWTEREHEARAATFRERQRGGFVRECHGDLHLGNIARIDGEMTIFDGIEFNDAMRWIDVQSEVAFTVMDLQERGRGDLAQRFLNLYLEITGDYAGVAVLRFYLAYRAMVRAKIALLRSAQPGIGEARRALLAEYRAYLDRARAYARPPRPAIIATHGLAGSGKTTLSQSLLETLGAVRLRTDVERKRLTGHAAGERLAAGFERGVYAPGTTEATYRHVAGLAGAVAAAGHVAIVDAACLKRWQRDLFRAEAARLQVPFVIVTFTASDATLRERLTRRAAQGRDASDADVAVLEEQLRVQEPLGPDERAQGIPCDTEGARDDIRGTAAWRTLVERIGAAIHRTPGADPPVADPGVGTKVAFLSLPASYPEPTSRVDVCETHMSWVFLTDRYAWKLKKPVRLREIDFGVAAARRINCTEEVRLNRRLSDDVYLDVVPLSLDESGRLRLAGDGHAIDWLVKMRRLPAARMLDRLIAGGHATAQDLVRIVGRLARFYRDGVPVAMTGEAFRRGFEQGIADHLRELGRPAFDLPPDLIATSAMQQRGLLERRPDLFDQRVADGRVLEAHGDLRPEHICVDGEPQIIDCLEFSYPLRVLDAADELAFLALECERLGAPAFAATIFGTYAEVTGDTPPPALLAFYQSYRASVRAMLAIRHLDDAAPREPSRWAPQARAYLELACRHGARIA